MSQVYFCAADRSMSGTTEATVGGNQRLWLKTSKLPN